MALRMIWGIEADLSPNECRIFDLMVLDSQPNRVFTAKGLSEVLLIAEQEVGGYISTLRKKFPDDRYGFQTVSVSTKPQIWGYKFIPRP